MGSSFSDASTTSAPRFCRIWRGPNSSCSSKPSVATINTLEFGIVGTGSPPSRNPLPVGSLMRGNESRKEQCGVLRHSSDAEPGITRKRMGRYWGYFDAERKRITGRDEIDRLNAIGLPPAYENAWFCADPEGHLQATGVDARGRKQYRYHPLFRQMRESAKFEGLIEFGKALPEIRRKVDKDLKQRAISKDKVVA